MGTPVQMYDSERNKTWDCTLDIYGKVATSGENHCTTAPLGSRDSMRMQKQYSIITGSDIMTLIGRNNILKTL